MLLIFALTACDNGAIVRGGGEYIIQSRDISGVRGVRVENAGEVHISIGDSETLTLSAYDNLLPLLDATVENGMLVLSQTSEKGYITDRPVVYDITVSALESLTLSGTASVVIDNLTGERFTVDSSGTGNITVNGAVTEQTVNISGLGAYYGFGLQTDITTVTISGTGDAQVTANDQLNATLIGKSDILYRGNPDVTQSITGTGEIIQDTQAD